MAADLVMDPKIPQTVEHDIESIFWVLLWLCFLYMDSDMVKAHLTSIIKETMSPLVYSDRAGNVKVLFMTSPVALKGYSIEGNQTMVKLLDDLRILLGKRHSCLAESPEDLQSDKHEAVLTLLRDAIDNQKWPTCDHAKPQTLAIF